MRLEPTYYKKSVPTTLKVVGLRGFEPRISASAGQRPIQYLPRNTSFLGSRLQAPFVLFKTHLDVNEGMGKQTPNLEVNLIYTKFAAS